MAEDAARSPEIRPRLGRGLAALLGEVGDEAPAAENLRAQRKTPIEFLRPNAHNPRKNFDEAELDELAASIKERGVIQPILVRAIPRVADAYEIVAGERRWRAAQRAGVRTIPALVRSLSDEEVLEIAIVENVQRSDLSPLEEAEGYRTLVDKFGRTQAQVADTVGKSRVHVANALRLLQLPEGVQAMVRDGRLTPGHVRPLIGVADAEQLAEEVIGRGLTVRQAETLARIGGRGGHGAPRNRSKDADTLALESDLAEVLGLPVEIRDAGGVGEVRVRYASLEQLDDICRRLTRG
jgi:ParB family chromosome partitioning protein